jgi:mannose-6-phosphate isomerase-like protein (cupin superfamily)
MVLAPGDAEGGADNRHKLRAGSLVLIERNEKHQIRNRGRGLLRTLNFYVPPAYRKDGNPPTRGKK